MSEDKVIEVENLNKCFKVMDESKANIRNLILRFWDPNRRRREVEALREINFSVRKGEVFGIIGSNGSGKSTLLNCLIGAMKPDEGSIVRTSGRVLKLSLGMGFDPNLTGRENVYVNGTVIGLTFEEIGARFQEIVDFSGLGNFIDSPVKSYSRGMRSRLMFSIAIFAEADIFMLDEFFGGVGDQDFKEKSSQIFEKTFLDGRTLILVSHSMNVIKTHCERVLWIDKGKQMMLGEPDKVVDQYVAHSRSLQASAK